jgi:hypothetical protein
MARMGVAMHRQLAWRSALILAAAFLTGACSQDIERVPEIYRPTNAHDEYLRSLVSANLGSSALARDWIAAAESALRDPVDVSSPFRESGYFDESLATAVGYLFSARGGQRIDVEVTLDTSRPFRLFTDLFRLVDDDPSAPIHVASGAASLGETGEDERGRAVLDPALGSVRRLRFEPLRDGVYVLRLQPELLRSGRYTVVLRVDASLTFPVAGGGTRDIGSVFGASRDAGRRSHHGVDIFAARGTPVLAASDGTVSRATTTAIGGNVVWVRDADRNMNLYYAHLDSHSVERGQRVRAGEQLGTVGNTGNARTTPPHLHFGVYARGPVDPDPFLRPLRTEPTELSVDLDRLGDWSRTADDAVEILAAPDRRARIIGSIEPLAPVRIWGASARYYRVGLPDGTGGYVIGDLTEPATPLRSESMAGAGFVLDRPLPQGAVIEELLPGDRVPVFGNFGDFLYVRTPGGLSGWLPIRATSNE